MQILSKKLPTKQSQIKNLKSLKFIHTFSLSHSYSPPLSLSTLALRLSHSFSPLILLLNPFGGGLCFLRFDQ